jgi:hypothetical protein
VSRKPIRFSYRSALFSVQSCRLAAAPCPHRRPLARTTGRSLGQGPTWGWQPPNVGTEDPETSGHPGLDCARRSVHCIPWRVALRRQSVKAVACVGTGDPKTPGHPGLDCARRSVHCIPWRVALRRQSVKAVACVGTGDPKTPGQHSVCFLLCNIVWTAVVHRLYVIKPGLPAGVDQMMTSLTQLGADPPLDPHPEWRHQRFKLSSWFRSDDGSKG